MLIKRNMFILALLLSWGFTLAEAKEEKVFPSPMQHCQQALSPTVRGAGLGKHSIKSH